MAYDYDNKGEDYEREDGSIFHVPVDTDVADAPLAFEQFAESIPFSEYVNVVTINGGTRGTQVIEKEDNGKMLFVTSDTTLDFSGITSQGFSVAAVADAGATITYSGVDKNLQTTTEYQVATVIRINDTNILSVADGELSGCGDCPECPEIPIAAEGTPPAPVITNPDGGSVIKFTSGGDGDAGVTLAYGATIEPQDGATVQVDQDNLEVQVSGTTAFTDYVVSIYAVNVAGKGEEVKTNAFQLNFNVASGGTEDDYVKDGYLWRQHKYDTSGTFYFDVETSVPGEQFFIRLIGRGGNGGYGDCPMEWPTLGGRGGFHGLTVDSLPVKSLKVVVGTSYAQNNPPSTATAHSSSLEDVGKAGGGGNGCRTFYCYQCSYGDAGTWGGNSTGLNGGTHADRCGQYSPQGGGGQNIASAGFHTLWNGQTGSWGYHGSHGNCDNNVPSPPGTGLVAITYRIGLASRAQIAADEERRRVMDESEESGRVRGLIEAADAHEQEYLEKAAARSQMAEEHPELADAIEAAAKADEEMRAAMAKPKRSRKKKDD
jgi:hypothetical protein